MENHFCKNCKTEFQGNYCSNCGQSSISNRRLKLVDIIKDFLDNTFNIHKGFFFTFWKLMVSPAAVSKAYIRGMRRKFTNPTRYLVIALAALAFSEYWFGSDEVIKSEEFDTIPFLSEQLNQSMQLWNLRLLTDWALLGNLLEALTFPVGFYFMFKTLKYNYAELLTISFYLVANSIFITIFFVGLPKFLFGIYMPAVLVVGVITIYYIYALITFFKETSIFKRVLLVLAGLIIFWLIRLFIIPLMLGLFFPLSNN